jgi:putative endonuclease
MTPSQIGRNGERYARRLLVKKGWRCVGKNLRFGNDELDILALTPDAKTLVIVEVRSTMDRRRIPEQTIGSKKRAAMLRVAKQLRGEAKKHNCTLRMDLITVRLYEKEPIINHFQGILKLSMRREFT